MDKPKPQDIRRQHLHRAPFHKRVDWGDMKLLAASIKEHGITVPLLVRARTRKDGGGYEIIAGVRRDKAAEMAGLAVVPCYVVDVDDLTAVSMQFDENYQRVAMHPLDEAGYFAEMDSRGMTPAEIAKRIGKPKTFVVRRMKLNALGERARDFYAKGKLDEASAFAIATVDRTSHQNDIIASIANGSLVLEEVPSYVHRTHSATLEDVPWRISDDSMKGGACTACPKRSSVQRELFGEVRGGERCLDVACHGAKMAATFVTLRKRPGVVEHDAPPDDVFVPVAGTKSAPTRASGMVDVNAPCPHVSGMTWEQAVKADADPENMPTLYLAKDHEGRPRFLFNEAAAARIVKRSEVKAASDSAKEARDPGPKQDIKLRKAVIDLLVDEAVTTEARTLNWTVARLIDGTTTRIAAQVAAAFEETIKVHSPGLEGKEALLALTRASHADLLDTPRRIALAIQIREAADVGEGFPQAIHDIAQILDVDIAGAEEGLRETSGTST